MAGKALLGEPPEELKITDHAPRQCAAKKAIAEVTVAAPDSSSTSTMGMLERMMGMQLMYMQGAMSGFSPVAPPPISPANTNAFHLRSLSTPITPCRPTQQSTQTLPPLGNQMKRPLSPSSIPNLDDWLSSLDQHPVRGKRAPNFIQYLPQLKSHEVIDLEDLSRLTSDELVALCGMPIGIAKRIKAYGDEDFTYISGAENKRAHIA